MISRTIIAGATMGLIVFGLWYYLNNFTQLNELHARNLILLLMVLMQNFHVFNARSERTSAFRIPIRRNTVLVFGVILAQGIHILSMYIPFMQNILHLKPVTLNEYLFVLTLAIPMIIVLEIVKFIRKRRKKND